MFDYNKEIRKHIEKLHSEKRYRIFRELTRQRGNFPVANYRNQNVTKQITIWCSNDYLGMGQHPLVLDAMHTALDTFGAGAGGTRNISGTHSAIVKLEEELADLHNKPAALAFSSGYVANQCTLCTLGSQLANCVIISDSDNHASMIEGIRHSRAEKHIFRHNDVEHLEQILKSLAPERAKIVAFEALYSMNGDRAPLLELITVCKKYGALIYVDETHSVALYGNRGGGLLQESGLTDQVDIIQGGLGKGFGVVGGFITASKDIVDFVRSYGAGFIFTTALPPIVAAGAAASIKYLKQSNVEREQMFVKVNEVKTRLNELALPILQTDTHIIPFMVRNSERCQQISDKLLEQHGVYIQPINYPTVAKGEERLRITPSPLHTEAQINKLVDSLDRVWSQANSGQSQIRAASNALWM